MSDLYSTEAEIEFRQFGHIAGRITRGKDVYASSAAENHCSRRCLGMH